MKIETKFDLSQKIYDIRGHCWEVVSIKLANVHTQNRELWEIYELGNEGTSNYTCCILPLDKDRFFATKSEAEQALKRLEGKDERICD